MKDKAGKITVECNSEFSCSYNDMRNNSGSYITPNGSVVISTGFGTLVVIRSDGPPYAPDHNIMGKPHPIKVII